MAKTACGHNLTNIFPTFQAIFMIMRNSPSANISIDNICTQCQVLLFQSLEASCNHPRAICLIVASAVCLSPYLFPVSLQRPWLQRLLCRATRCLNSACLVKYLAENSKVTRCLQAICAVFIWLEKYLTGVYRILYCIFESSSPPPTLSTN